MFERLKNIHGIKDEEIVGIFLTGSSLFLQNYKDIDYIVVYRKSERQQREFINTYGFDAEKNKNVDIFAFSEELFLDIINFNQNNFFTSAIYSVFFNTHKPIKNELNIKVDIFSNKEKYLNILRYACDVYFLLPEVYWIGHENYCKKTFWSVILGLMFLENNSYEVTPEMIDIVQKCHDGCLSKSWEDWVRDRLYTDK